MIGPVENGNGGNGHVDHGGGNGGILDPLDRTRQRESLRLIQRAVHNGWHIKDEWLREVPKLAAKIMADSQDERNRLRAAQLLEDILARACDAAIALDKIERLDGGQATERVEAIQVNIPGEADFADRG